MVECGARTAVLAYPVTGTIPSVFTSHKLVCLEKESFIPIDHCSRMLPSVCFRDQEWGDGVYPTCRVRRPVIPGREPAMPATFSPGLPVLPPIILLAIRHAHPLIFVKLLQLPPARPRLSCSALISHSVSGSCLYPSSPCCDSPFLEVELILA